MTFDLSRRAFALTTLSASVALGFLPTFAKADGYAHPELLVEPADVTVDSDALLIDVRSLEEYDAGHIPGAVWLDPNAVVAGHSPVSGALQSTTEIAQLLSGLGVSPERRVILYDDRGGFHAARMFWLLEYFGHLNVALLNGGLTVWLAAGGAVTEEATIATASLFHPAISPRRYASADDVLRGRDMPGAVLIDVRPPKLFVKGHVPWAVNIPWAKNLDADKRFKSAEVLRVNFAEHGVGPDNDVIMHCQNGLASAHSYVALRLLGFARVRVYHRSWAEWGSDPSLPKAVS